MKRALCALSLFLALPTIAQRLPGNVVPRHYTLRIEPDLDKETFRGEETIHVDLEQRVKTIELHAVMLTLRDVTVDGQPATVAEQPKSETVLLQLAAPLGPGPAAIHIAFDGTLRQQLRGFYLSTTRRRKYAVSQFEATDARRAFPCFDEPAMKARFDITLVAPRGDVAIANTPIVSDKDLGDGRHEVRFATTTLLPTYLVAMLVGDFRCTAGEANGVPIRVCATPEQAGLTKFALRAAEDETKFYDKYYRIHYPFAKLDSIGIPDFQAGAMENAAAITFRETSLLADDEASASRRRDIAGTMAHEIAHQWFGDLVTMKWWNDIWLNEGFATFMTPKAVMAAHPEWDTQAETAWDGRRSVSVDAMRATRPIRSKAETPAEINSMFDGIAYGKTAAVLRMIEHWTGEEPFRNGITAYLGKYSFANAAGEDFWNTMSRATGRAVDKVMPSFVQQAGVPVVVTKATCVKGVQTVDATQERFIIAGGEASKQTSSKQAWQIPICARAVGQAILPARSGGRDKTRKADAGQAGLPVLQERCTVVSKPSERITFPGCESPLVLNARGRGYYVTQYAPEDLAVLRPHLGELSAPERITLLGDDWMLVRARRRKISDDLALIDALPPKLSRYEIVQIADRIEAITDDLATDADREAWQRWVSKTMRRWLPDTMWTVKPGESDEQRELRAKALGALGYGADDPEVVRGARELALRYIDNAPNVDATLADEAMIVAATHGDAALYDRIFEALQKETVPDRHRTLAGALLEFRDPKLARRALEYATGGDVRSQDTPGYLRTLLKNPAARPMTWEWMRTHWDEVSRKLPWSLGTIVSGLGSGCEPATLREINDFFSTHHAPGAERRIRVASEELETCIAFKDGQAGELAAFLAQ
jgi:aminopeptidase N